MSETFLDGRVTLHCGDCLKIMADLPERSIDAVVCDPPYHLQSITKRFAKTGRTDKTRTTSGPHQRTAAGFMNKQWDGGDVAFRIKTWEAVLRVLKPGGYLVAFSSTRTFGRMSVAIEDAGFIVHPFVAWIFAQGFPKAHKVNADEWEGWRYGTQSLKPAIEPIFVGQKPFENGLTGTENVLKWGVGALNIDDCRIPIEDELPHHRTNGGGKVGNGYIYGDYAGVPTVIADAHAQSVRPNAKGRWPSNVILDGSDEVLAAFPDAPGQQRYVGPEHGDRDSVNCYGDYGARPPTKPRDDGGSAARFFTRLRYSNKAASDDRLGSRHPTVKPVDLMQWLVRLVTPPKSGTVLDCFAGTGTTAEAAYREGFNAVLIEREAEYQADIRRRMALMLAGPAERSRESIKANGKTADAGPLFAAGRLTGIAE